MKRNYKNKKRYNQGIPSGVMRLDAELMSEIKLFVSLGNTIEQAACRYKVSESMVRFAIKKGKDFDSLQNDLIKECEE